jgi:phosphatidylglycerol---prolipoprotein diacylglyceryl transferase
MLPILFKVGPVQIFSYGFFLTLAYLAGTFVFWREGRKRGFNEEKLLDLSIVTLIASLIGGRALYVLLNWSYFQEDPRSILYFWQGGFAYFGSLIFGFLAAWFLSRSWKWPFFQIADLGALAVSLSFAIGKIGAFLAGTDYGVQTSLPWGVVFPNLVGVRHPVQLYETAASLLIFLVLLRVYFKNISKSGEIRSGRVFFDWLVFSASARFFFEYLRADSTFFAGVAIGHIFSLILASIGLVGIYYFGLRNFRTDLRIFLKRATSLDFRIRKSLQRRQPSAD